MINFLHNYLPQSILFQFGWLRIYWYGIFVVLGVIAGLIVVLKLAKKYKIPADEVYNLGFYLIIFGLIGARIYTLFLDLPFYLSNPFEIIAVWHGGLAIHGAIIGGAATLIIYCYKKRESFWQWADLIAPAIAIGQAFGRWGNYFNQEIFGRPTNLPWGIPIAFTNRPLQHLSSTYFHPTFLYESGLNLLNFLILILLFKRTAKKPGLIFLIYLINYSIIRIGMEFLRIDQTLEILGIRLPILVSLGIIGLSLGLIIKKLKFSQ
jgi:phosphatidylglycerol:prolipoprotein diacylglycerol transferase